MPTATATRTADQARDSIHRALPGPKGDQWSTARAVAEVVDMGYSTVTEHLRAMVEAGTVATTKQGRSSVFRKNGASPKLRKTDPVTGRATVTGKARREETPAEVETNARAAGQKFAEDIAKTYANPGRTVCGRSMRTGVTLPLWGVPDGCKPCPRCFPANGYGRPPESESLVMVWMPTNRKGVAYHEPAAPESAAADTEPAAVPQPPPAARTPTGGGVGDTVAFLESVRPVSAAPAAPGPKTRVSRQPKTDRQQPHTVFGRGELQAAILDHLRAHDGEWFTPTEVARAVNSGAGASAYALDRLLVKGEAVKADDPPMRYQAG